MDWYLKVLQQYADFSGRARRKEYWMFLLFHLIFAGLLGFLIFYTADEYTYDDDLYKSNSYSIFNWLFLIYILGTLIPSIAVTVRRLHDIGKSGFWYFITLIPYIGGFWLFILTCMEGENKTNEWGKSPKGIDDYKKIDLIGKE